MSNSEALERVRALMHRQIPFNRVLGIEVTALEPGFARLEIPFRDELIGDPMRPALHGGVLSSVLDTGGGCAAFTLVDFPSDRVSTLDLRIDYLRPGERKRLICDSRVTRMGNRVASVDGTCYHPDAPTALIATGKAVYSVRRGS